MPLIVEDGSRPEGANTYVTLAEVNAHAALTMHAAAWAAKTDPEKEAIIATACRTIDAGYDWEGFLVLATQPMAWPRSRVFFRGVELTEELDSNKVPHQVKRAASEYSVLLAVGGDRTGDQDSDGLKSVKLGKGAVEVEFDKTAKRPILGNLIAPILKGLVKGAALGGKRQIPIGQR